MTLLARLNTIAAFMVLAFLFHPNGLHAQNSRNCAWPIEVSPEGSGNVVLPESSARDFFMPFLKQYDTMTIRSAYPNVRYFSFVAYNTNSDSQKTPVGMAGDLYDANIIPDRGAVNPFVKHGAGNGSYTVTIQRNGATSGNTIGISSDFVWIFLRMYLPRPDANEAGLNLTGGLPLPTVTITANGTMQELQPCSPINKLTDVNTLIDAAFPVVNGERIDLQGTEGTPASDRLWFAPVTNPPALFPNPHNKYTAMLPGDNYQPGRIIVIHGKAPGFPDTFEGSPISVPARGFRSVDVRYWSLCNNDLALPISVVGCLSDLLTDLKDGDYTIVISDDLQRPDWLKPDINWLPYGDEQYPKLVLFRNMLPSPNFPFAVQNAIEAGCSFDFQFPKIPSSDDFEPVGHCAEQVMGDYYPAAAWCDKSKFVEGGFRACLSERHRKHERE